LQASGSSDQVGRRRTQARLAAQFDGTVAATGPGVTLTIETAPGVPAETMLDVINELRAAGAEDGDPRRSGGPGRRVDTRGGDPRALAWTATLNPVFRSYIMIRQHWLQP
jgi:hypothetical protein